MKKTFIRQHTDTLWQWRTVTENGEWLPIKEGDDNDVCHQLSGMDQDITLVLAGENILQCTMVVDNKQRRHLSQLMPYEIEDKVIDNVENLHFSYSAVTNNVVSSVYVSSVIVDDVLKRLQPLQHGIRTIIPDYSVLPSQERVLYLICDDQRLLVRKGMDIGFTVELPLANAVLNGVFGKSLSERSISDITLVAESEDAIHQVISYLPDGLREELEANLKFLEASQEENADVVDSEDISINMSIVHGGFWQFLESMPPIEIQSLGNVDINIRSGVFSRQLPFKRWWLDWRTAASVMVAACVMSLVVTFGDYWGVKQQQQDTLAEINRVYQQVAPNGRKGDPEGALRSILKGKGASGAQSSNVIVLLSHVAGVLKTTPNITLSSFRYNIDQQELRLNIDATDFSELEGLRNAVEKKGLVAELLRVNATGDKHQASMKVSEVRS